MEYKSSNYSATNKLNFKHNTNYQTNRLRRKFIWIGSISLLITSLTVTYYISYAAYYEYMLAEFNQVNNHICQYLFSKNLSWLEYMVVRNIQSPLHRNFANLTNPHTCNEFKLFHGEVVQSTLEEKQFPLAFSLAVHANIKQAARLLRLIYRSHNMYCIHVDSKSPRLFYDEVMQLARCFGSNVIVVNRSESVNVKWGYYSVLEVFLLCAEKLINNSEIIWKYILNVSGQELPLRTNWELVALLKAMNGSNIVENLGPKHNPERWPKKNLTFPIIWSKGSFYMALKRDFVHFYQTDPKAKEILDALKAERKEMKHPDELFFSTLNSNPLLGAPGSCNQTYLTSDADVRSKYIGRYVKWDKRRCRRGRIRHGICLIGISILPYIPERMELFANKFSETFEPIAYDCTENYIMEKVLTEMKTHQLNPNFNVSFYSQLYCSQDHVH
ncbi:unnamed protein product [Schistosoma turkestanicum]|nr:unnamed protein product [Schistosoma turkestanicum]